MSPVFVDKPSPTTHALPMVRRIDDQRGLWGMALFISTEASLFLVLFFSYYWLDKTSSTWRAQIPPQLNRSLPMLAILVVSNAILLWGHRQVKRELYARGRWALVASIILGFGFLGLAYFDYIQEFIHLTPTVNSYGSMFYTIVTIHESHVLFGLLMMLWVLILPSWEPRLYSPHRPYANITMFWTFSTILWFVIVVLFYIAPVVYNAL